MTPTTRQSENDRIATREDRPMKTGDLVRFVSERDGGPVHRVVWVAPDGMIELHDRGGYFAPHLFVLADDVADIPPIAAENHARQQKEEAARTADAAADRREEERVPLALERVADALEGDWLPMCAAKKNRTPVLLLLRDDLDTKFGADAMWNGIQFVGIHTGIADSGFDVGWSFAAPVGRGGFPDQWLVGWRPLPPARQSRKEKPCD